MTKVTEGELLDVISKEAFVERARLTRDATLADLGISSLDVITMLFEVEERWGVLIEEGEMPPMQTLGDMVDFLLAKINGSAAAS